MHQSGIFYCRKKQQRRLLSIVVATYGCCMRLNALCVTTDMCLSDALQSPNLSETNQYLVNSLKRTTHPSHYPYRTLTESDMLSYLTSIRAIVKKPRVYPWHTASFHGNRTGCSTYYTLMHSRYYHHWL
jgi:hypothetical protein